MNVTVTGRIVQPGTAENRFTYAMANGTLAQNYNIIPVFGTLTVTEVEVERHKLTITYVYSDKDEIIKVFSREYVSGEAYSVASGKIDGYEPDIYNVAGRMGNEDIDVTVTYSPITYTLTVKYVSVTDGRQVADTVTMQLKKGDKYTVFTPKVEGYKALRDEVNGTMPGNDKQVTVFMVPLGNGGGKGGNGTGDGYGGAGGLGGGGYNDVELDDYGTPLGVPESILGGGEVIE